MERQLTDKEQEDLINQMLKINPVDLAEYFVREYENDYLNRFTNSENRKHVKKMIDKCREELVNVSVQYGSNVGLTLREFYQHEGLVHTEHYMY